jgi:hypothetical protein
MDQFDSPGVGRLPLSCMLTLGTRILLKLLHPEASGETKALDIIGTAKTLLALMWKGRTVVFVNPRRAPWMGALLLFLALILPREESTCAFWKWLILL